MAARFFFVCDVAGVSVLESSEVVGKVAEASVVLEASELCENSSDVILAVLKPSDRVLDAAESVVDVSLLWSLLVESSGDVGVAEESLLDSSDVAVVVEKSSDEVLEPVEPSQLASEVPFVVADEESSVNEKRMSRRMLSSSVWTDRGFIAQVGESVVNLLFGMVSCSGRAVHCTADRALGTAVVAKDRNSKNARSRGEGMVGDCR